MPDDKKANKPKGAAIQQKSQFPYESKMWKGVVRVFHCLICGRDLNDEGDMMLHVASHAPVEHQTEVLEALLDEQQVPANKQPKTEKEI